MRKITRTVWILSLVSLCMDLASEMLYPIMPVYLQSIGFSVLLIGLLEGLADIIAGLSKGYFGHWSDVSGKRMPFVRLGYALSALSKPLLGIFTIPIWVFGARSMDRLGKGLRTAPRDALLSEEATEQTKGQVFGFHRSMDTVGAIGGPLIALLWLYFNPGSYQALFFLAFAPGILSLGLTFFVREKEKPLPSPSAPPLSGFFNYRKTASSDFRKISGLLILFALFNSSDAFLLLWVKQAGHSDNTVIWFYIFYNCVFALSAYPLGRLADKGSLKYVVTGGLLLFSVVYFFLGRVSDYSTLLVLFAFYGLFTAATEGMSKAWISNLCKKEDTATGLGSFLAYQSIAQLLASTITGFLWFKFGASFALTISAVGALLVAIGLILFARRKTLIHH